MAMRVTSLWRCKVCGKLNAKVIGQGVVREKLTTLVSGCCGGPVSGSTIGDRMDACGKDLADLPIVQIGQVGTLRGREKS